jgi:hypothetical protein
MSKNTVPGFHRHTIVDSDKARFYGYTASEYMPVSVFTSLHYAGTDHGMIPVYPARATPATPLPVGLKHFFAVERNSTSNVLTAVSCRFPE